MTRWPAPQGCALLTLLDNSVGQFSLTNCGACAAEAVPYFVTDLQNVRLAAEYVRSILRKWPNLKQDLRDLFWKVDSGEAVNIAALPDPQLRGALHATFDYLNLHITREVRFVFKHIVAKFKLTIVSAKPLQMITLDGSWRDRFGQQMNWLLDTSA